MNNLLQSNIFFFITSIFVLILIIGAGIVIFYLVRILRDLRAISKLAKDQSTKVAEEIDTAMAKLKNGEAAGRLVWWFSHIFKRRKVGKKDPD
jgi:hypothetical protein